MSKRENRSTTCDDLKKHGGKGGVSKCSHNSPDSVNTFVGTNSSLVDCQSVAIPAVGEAPGVSRSATLCLNASPVLSCIGASNQLI